MNAISNDTEFKTAINGLTSVQQRLVGARFVSNVIGLSNDERLDRVLKTAMDESSSSDELSSASKTARSAAIDSHTRCGAESDWNEQAGYFVARAASALVASDEQLKGGSTAWQAAVNSRMARTCESIDADEQEQAHKEAETQYGILQDFLNE